jgi:hypothetical protein
VDFYEDGIYLVIVAIAFALVVGAIMLMSRGMRSKKRLTKKAATVSRDVKPETVSAELQERVQDRPEPQAERREYPREERQEKLKNVPPLQENKSADAGGPEAILPDLPETNPLAEEILKDAEEHETTLPDLKETNPIVEENSEIEKSVEIDAFTNLFQTDEIDYSEVTGLAGRLSDVDLNSLRELTEEVSRVLARVRKGGHS